MKDGYTNSYICPVCNKPYLRTGNGWAYTLAETATSRKVFCSYTCMRKYEQLKFEPLSDEDRCDVEHEFRSGLTVDAIAHKHHCRVDDVEDIVINL